MGRNWPIGVLSAAILAAPAATGAMRGVPAAASAPPGGAHAVTRNWEHRYRVDGRLRLLVRWMGRSNVGSARMTREDDGRTSALTFVAGSNPERAPLRVNQWGYARETTEDGQGRAFILRTLDPRDPAVPEADLARSREPVLVGASCGAVAGDVSRASLTGFRIEPRVGFHAIDRVLDVAEAATWTRSRVTTAATVYPGMFSALQATLDESVSRTLTESRDTPLPVRIYSYRGELFELAATRLEPAAGDSLRASFTYTKRSTAERGSFTVVFGARGEHAGVPLEMVFQPSWWVRVTLRLDDSVALPGGADDDRAMSSRIDSICARVLSPPAGR